jgi:hypothetical protein
MRDRSACCLNPSKPCGPRFTELRSWVGRVVGKAVRLVTIEGDEQGKAPFFAQPVGFDGRAFFIVGDGLCDTEKLLHEACHFLMAPRERRNSVNYGLGPGPFRPVDDFIADNEELCTSLLQRMIAPHFHLTEDMMPRPDYNVASRRHLDWDDCERRAAEVFERVRTTLPPP